MGGNLITGGKSNADNLKKCSGFTPKQVEMIKERFEMMCDDDMTLDKTKMGAILKISPAECDTLMAFFDADQSGKVDSYEFMAGLSLLSHSTLDEKFEMIFELYDFDKSGVITKDELIILIKTVTSSLGAIGGVAAQQNDVALKESEKKADEILTKWDTNKDGKLSLKEFKSFMMKDGEILKTLQHYGLVPFEDVPEDFGGGNDAPEGDSDLEHEINQLKNLDDDKENPRVTRIKAGIEGNFLEDEDGDFVLAKVGQGDQALAVKPWQAIIQNGVPSDYKPKRSDGDAPEGHLTLNYVYGYRSYDSRNNLKFTESGKVAYHAASIGIVLDPKTNEQTYFQEHSDDIIAFTTWGKYCATGQVGLQPLICLWDLETRENMLTISGLLEKGVNQLAFSKDGNKLAAASVDEAHTIAIYDVDKLIKMKKSGQIPKNPKTDGVLAIGKGPSAGILDLRFDPFDGTLMAACIKELNYIKYDGGRITLTKGTGWGKNPQQALTCLEFMDNKDVVTGSFSGNLFVWKNKTLVTTMKGHESTVNCLTRRNDAPGFLSGGNDGMIILWDGQLRKQNTLNLKTSKLVINPKIRALDANKKGDVLVGTRGSEIIIFPSGTTSTSSTPNKIMSGHFDEELWGLAVSPVNDEFVTAGRDNLLCVWHTGMKTLKRSTKLEYAANSVEFNNPGTHLAVGCRNGFVMIVDVATLNVTTTLKDRTKEVNVLKYSPNNNYLAVGGADSEIFIYNVTAAGGYKIVSKFRGHHSAILHLDFSVDSNVIQSMCSSYELLYFDPATGKRNPAGATKYKDEKWATWSLTIGWHVQGIWPPCSDGTDINAADRNLRGDVIATVDDFSKVKLFKFPSPVPRSNYNKYSGHSSHVTNVRFTNDNTYLITTGGNDKTIMQWKYTFDESAEEEAKGIDEIEGEQENRDEEVLFEKEEVKEGDQALSVKPFLGQVKNSIPSGWKMPPQAGEVPNGNLTLHHIHGWRSFDAANNIVRYTSTGKIIYPAAAVGVVMDTTSGKQSFFQGHEEDIVSLALHPKGGIAATGQVAQRGRSKMVDLYVWDVESKQKLAHLKSHVRGILALAFSPSGNKLLSIGGDEDFSLAVHEWSNSRLIAMAKTDKARISDIAWSSENSFATVGKKHIKFWTLNGTNLTSARGVLGNPKCYPITSVTFAFSNNSVCLTGCADGTIFPWINSSPLKEIKAHEGFVNALLSYKNNLFSGGADGKIIMWSWGNTLTKVAEFANLTKLTKFPAGVRSLDCRVDNKLLVGTRGGEVFEITKTGQITTYVQGHWDGELWGLATEAKGNRVATCGGDQSVRVWNISSMKMLISITLPESDARSIDWSPDGKLLVVGDVNGQIILLNPDTLAISDKVQSSFGLKEQWIEEIKFSPNSQMVALGAHKGRSTVEVMAVKSGKLTKYANINVGLSSALLHLDWSTDGTMVVVNSQAYELKFVNVNTQSDVAASAAKDVDWFTWTCKFGFPVQGIFQGPDFTDVNTVCRGNNRRVVATGDDFGKVNLFKYPCVVEKAKAKQYIGHSSHLTRVRFSSDDGYLYSVGGNDKCFFVWETDFAGEKPPAAVVEASGDVRQSNQKNNVATSRLDIDDQTETIQGAAQEIEVDITDFVQTKKVKQKKNVEPPKPAPAEEEDNLFEMETNDHGDEFMSVKPWLGAIKEPKDFKKTPVNQEKPPCIKLALEHVHGYRAKDSRNNLRYLKNGSIVFPAAALGIVMDVENNVQTFFDKHTDDVTALDVHPDGILVATGELGPKPVIYVWNSDTTQIMFSLKGGVTKGIATLSFSISGTKLAAACTDENHTVALFDMKTGTLDATQKGDASVISELRFKDDQDFVTVGPKHFKTWHLESKSMKSKKGVFNSGCNILTTCAFNNEDCLVGAANGELQIWHGVQMSKAIPLHKQGIDALSVDINYVLTGAKDCVINILDRIGYTTLLTVDMKIELKTSVCPRVRSVSLSRDWKTLLVGTYGSEIYELSTKDSKIGKTTKFTKADQIVAGHFTPNSQAPNEVWGLAVFHDGKRFATCSHDGTLRVWSIEKKNLLTTIDLNTDLKGNRLPHEPKTQDLAAAARGCCLDISSDEALIAIGCEDGTIRILQGKSFETNTIFKHRTSAISDVKFSPNCESLAVGSHEGYIDVYQLPSFKKKCSLKKHSSYITHLDWSEHSTNLQSNCGGYELLFWDLSGSGQHMPGGATALRDEKWATWTCVLGWPVQGIWPMAADGTDINAVHRSTDQHPGGYNLLAAGDDKGKLRVLRYPSLKKNSESVTGKGHSSHVTNVRWSFDDKALFSTGGEDNCVFQWKVVASK